MKLTALQHRDAAALLRTFAASDDLAAHYAAEFKDADRAGEMLDRRDHFYRLADFHEAAALDAVEITPAREIAGLTDGPTHFYTEDLSTITPGDDAIATGT